MTIVWIIIGLAILVALSIWYERHEKAQAEAIKHYILETTEIERRLALLNPRLARGVPLEPGDQAWLEKMLFERRITSDPAKWVQPDLGYDAISGTSGEFFAAMIESGGSTELLEIKAEKIRIEKAQRMIADIGMPETQDQIDRWWAEHSADGSKAKKSPDDRSAIAQLPNHRIYHAAVVR